MATNPNHTRRQLALFQRVLNRPWIGILWTLLVLSPAAQLSAIEGPTAVDTSKLPAPAAKPVEFTRDIEPVLQRTCFQCHGAEKQKSSFRLDRRADAMRGGEHGVAIVPGHSDQSPLIHYVAGLVEDMVMPPPKSGAQKLTSAEIGLLRAWIDQGASWPKSEQVEANNAAFWTFQKAVKPAVPSPNNAAWPRNDVDRFILARLEHEGLSPAPEADRKTLIRRVSFDLTGLPPTPEEIDAFLADEGADAYERMLDRLLASPRYGERWGRHWLDVVHYGETHGYDKDKPRLSAWPYRDYVIRAFNEDKPYGQFVQEQLAGDVLFPDDPNGVVATGFIAAGPWDFVGHAELSEAKTDGLIARYNDRDDMVMTTMSTFQSLTVHCARCHDHKFDPISQEDYYSLQAVFAGVDRAERSFDPDPAVFRKRKELQAQAQRLTARKETLEAAVVKSSPHILKLVDARSKELAREQTSLDKALEAKAAGGSGESSNRVAQIQRRAAVAAELSELAAERKELERNLVEPQTLRELAETEAHLAEVNGALAALPAPQKVFAAAHDFAPIGSFHPAREPRPISVLRRGDVKQPLRAATPGALSCLPGMPSRFTLDNPAAEGDRRAALAKWITAPENLLTRRSIVNRVWLYHFGRGLVDTPNDFGHMGSLPSHPELLDWLAFWFREHGESIKALHRLLLTSATYRQSVATNPAFAKLDSDNRLLWRMNRVRLDAEALRDSVLFVAGRLDLTEGGPSVQQFYFKDDHSPVYDYTRFDIDRPEGQRRSVYRFIVRSVPDPFMESFDCPDASILTPKRETTVTALQALSLLNDPFILRQCEYAAQRVAGMGSSRSAQVNGLCRLAFGRRARPAEASSLIEYAERSGLTNLCRVVLNSNEFVFVE